MIKKLINNANYSPKEFVIVLAIILLIIIISINQFKFKSTDYYRGKQLHQGGFYVGKILSTPTISIDKVQKNEFKKLNTFMNDEKLSKNGFPFIIYTSKNEKLTQYIIAIPIEDCENVDLPLKFVCNYFPKQDVLTVIHEGYLYDRYKGWKILDDEIIKKKKKIFNAPFEIFWKGIEQSKDSTTWVTGLYYPIK